MYDCTSNVRDAIEQWSDIRCGDDLIVLLAEYSIYS